MNLLALWLGVVVTFASGGICLTYLWALVGISSPSLLFLVLSALMIVAPLEGLAAINLSTIALATLKDEPAVNKVLLAVSLWLMHGLELGLGMVLLSKFLPTFAKKATVKVSLPTWLFVHNLIDRVLPQTLQTWLGVGFTLFTELCILPAAVALLFATAKLKYAGETFDRFQRSTQPKNQSAQVVVLIHGNRFNECQWHFPRMLMHARGLHEATEIITVNYFGGPIMRNHGPKTSTVEGCSREVVSQIQAELKLRGVEDISRVVLIGHSLGGVVSAYIKENLAAEHGLPVSNVVAISAPLGGSALLEWAHKKPFLRRTFRTGNQFSEFFPENTEMLKLRAKMAENASDYFAVTGACDPLVRPESALLSFLPTENKRLIPYLGHYNIKISYRALSAVLSHVERVVHQIDTDATASPQQCNVDS